MKKITLLGLACIAFCSCSRPPKIENQLAVNDWEEHQSPGLNEVKQINYRDTTYTKVIKDLKEVQETRTDYHYKYDWLNSKFRQQPKISAETQYFVIYTDFSHEEVNRDTWLSYSKGDSIRKTDHIHY